MAAPSQRLATVLQSKRQNNGKFVFRKITSDWNAGTSSNLAGIYMYLHPFSTFSESHNQFVANHRNVSLFELSWLVETLRLNSGYLF